MKDNLIWKRTWLLYSISRAVCAIRERFTQQGNTATLTQSAVPIDPAQSWYWRSDWQDAEREADLDLATGRYTDFSSMETFIRTIGAEPKLDDLINKEQP